MEHHTFAYPKEGLANDQFDPRYAGFYGPPIPGDMNDGGASQVFQEDWLARVQELIDKYEPQLIYFDNGVNPRVYDPIKLRAATYYFNSALKWGKEVTFGTKDWAYLAGSRAGLREAAARAQVDLPLSVAVRRRHRQHLGLHRIAAPDELSAPPPASSPN